MKVQCDVCEKAEASVMCCADEAALCADCDSRIHRANKLASKHQRVSLLYTAADDLTCCDICQEKAGFFFCLEDRALLCRSCDYSIHSANALTAKHRRFLVAGIRVALEASPITIEREENLQACSKPEEHFSTTTKATELGSSKVAPPAKVSSSRLTDSEESYRRAPLSLMAQQSQSCISYEQSEKGATTDASPLKSDEEVQALPLASPGQEAIAVLPSKLDPVPENTFNYPVQFNSNWDMCPNTADVHTKNTKAGSVIANHAVEDDFIKKNSVSEYLTETIPGWRMDELLSFAEGSSTCNFADYASSKTDGWFFGDKEWQADCNTFNDLILAQGPAEVPSLPSPSTSSGVVRPTRGWGVGKFMKPSDFDCLFECDDIPTVPDIGASPPMKSTIATPFKRQRTGLEF